MTDRGVEIKLGELQRELQRTKDTLEAGMRRVRSQQEMANHSPNLRINGLRSAQSATNGSPGLGAIVVPTNLAEREQILANFALWARDDFAPTVRPGSFKPRLAFVFNNDTASPLESEIIDAYLSNGMDRYFAAPEFRYLGLTAERDVYVRSNALASGREGHKAGPNNQFFETMRLGREFGHCIFLMETDCVPIRRDWLRRLIKIARGPEPFYILGSAYRGHGTIGSAYNRHLNGNALYACGDPGFQSFVNDFWEPNLRRMVESEDRRIAYDCVLEMLFTTMHSNDQQDEIWHIWQRHAHLFRYSDYIQDISARKDVEEPPPDLVESILTNSPHTYIVHSQPLARAAVEMLGNGEPVGPRLLRPKPIRPVTSEPGAAGLGFVAIHPSSAVERRGTAYVLPAGSSDNYVMVVFAGAVTAGDQVEGRVTIHLSNPSTVTVSLNRHGDTPFEGTSRTAELSAGPHSLKVSHGFRDSHQGARMQIGVDGEPADISFPGNIEMVKLGADRDPSPSPALHRLGSHRPDHDGRRGTIRPLTRIVTFGNCQAEAVASLLSRALPATRYSLSFYSNNDRTGDLRPEPEILKAVREADLLVFQPLDESHGALSEASIRATVRNADSAVSFPYVFNSGICSLGAIRLERGWEWLRQGPKGRQPSLGIVFGEETIVRRLEQGVSAEAILDEYVEGSLDFGLLERFESCMVELERREKSTAIVLAGHIRQNYRRKRQFLTHNHPTTDLLVELCEQLRALTDLPIDLAALRRIEDENAAGLPAERLQSPISPHDAAILGYQFGNDPDWVERGGGLILRVASAYARDRERRRSAPSPA